MSEDEKIEQVIQEFKAYFDYSDADICHTRKGAWFFFRYDAEHDDFICFNMFNTAEELRAIITSELMDEVCLAIEVSAEAVCNRDYEEEINNMLNSYDFEGRVTELLYNLAVINNHITKYGGVFRALYGLVSNSVKPR